MKPALQEGIAATFMVPKEQVTITGISAARRLDRQLSSASGGVKVDFEIEVPEAQAAKVAEALTDEAIAAKMVEAVGVAAATNAAVVEAVAAADPDFDIKTAPVEAAAPAAPETVDPDAPTSPPAPEPTDAPPDSSALLLVPAFLYLA